MRINTLLSLSIFFFSFSSTLALPQRLINSHLQRRSLIQALKAEIALELADISNANNLVRRGHHTDKLKAKLPGRLGQHAREREAQRKDAASTSGTAGASGTAGTAGTAGTSSTAAASGSGSAQARPPSSQAAAAPPPAQGNTPPTNQVAPAPLAVPAQNTGSRPNTAEKLEEEGHKAVWKTSLPKENYPPYPGKPPGRPLPPIKKSGQSSSQE